MARVAVRELRVEKVAPGGDGVAFVDDSGERRAVFLPLVAPGDLVRAEIDLAQKPARGRVLTVLEPSAARVSVPCRVAARCGGCDFMHLSSAAQREAHEAIVREALPASVRSEPIRVHAPAGDAGLRTRARLHVRAQKQRVEVGFVGARSHDIVEADTCLVLAPALDAVRGKLATWLAGAKGRGEARIALGAFDARKPVLDLSFQGELPPALFATLERAVNGGELAGARVLEHGAKRPATFGDATPWMRAADGEPLRLAAGGFGQASDEGNALLGAHVRALAEPILGAAPDAPAVELFSGAGNFTVALAARTAKLVAVESDEAACEAARANLKARGLAAKIVCGDADAYALPRGLRLVVLDPPRTGARGACARIVAARPTNVVYVSCDPPTLGRDLAVLLEAGYRCASIDLFELFPHTSHVETVVLLRRGEAA